MQPLNRLRGDVSERESSSLHCANSPAGPASSSSIKPGRGCGEESGGRAEAAVQAWPGPGHAQSLSTLCAPSVVLRASALPRPGGLGCQRD